MLHKSLTPSERHAPHSFEYASSSERTAATGLSSQDVNKLALQLNDGTYWRLASISPVTWASVGSQAGGGDMLKSAYDSDNDGVVDAAEVAYSTREPAVAVTAANIDLSAGAVFSKTISGVTTFTVSSVPAAGNTASFILELTNGGSAAVSWWAGMKWAGGTAPTLTAAGIDILGFYTRDGGTTWRGVVLAKDSK